jgi:hypothetical protein
LTVLPIVAKWGERSEVADCQCGALFNQAVSLSREFSGTETLNRVVDWLGEYQTKLIESYHRQNQYVYVNGENLLFAAQLAATLASGDFSDFKKYYPQSLRVERHGFASLTAGLSALATATQLRNAIKVRLKHQPDQCIRLIDRLGAVFSMFKDLRELAVLFPSTPAYSGGNEKTTLQNWLSTLDRPEPLYNTVINALVASQNWDRCLTRN